MGCTDERSVSNKSQKKSKHNFSSQDSSNKNEKKGPIANQEKININEEEEKQNSIKEIQFNHEENNNAINNINININNNEDNKDDDDDDDDEVNNEEIEDDKSGTEEFEDDEMDPDVPEMNRDIYREIAPYLQARVNPNFNFPEVKEDIYVGLGLRRMKAFKCPISKEELKQRREAFWETRIEGDAGVWQFLKELCELPVNEDENIKPMLEANEITPLKNCLNVTYDRGGEVYEIPNYCINEPYSYDLPESHIKRPEKKKISFHGRRGGEQFKIKTENYTKVDSIRKNIGKKFQKDVHSVRLFFRGSGNKNNGNNNLNNNINNYFQNIENMTPNKVIEFSGSSSSDGLRFKNIGISSSKKKEFVNLNSSSGRIANNPFNDFTPNKNATPFKISNANLDKMFFSNINSKSKA